MLLDWNVEIPQVHNNKEKTFFPLPGQYKEVTYKSVENETKRVIECIILSEDTSMEWPICTNLKLTQMTPPPKRTIDSVNAMVNLLQLLQGCSQEKSQS